MLLNVIYLTFIIKLSFAQINGEFWWLNSKLAAIRNVEPSQPRVDETVSEFDTDENDKIIFRDVEIPLSNEAKINHLKEQNNSTEKAKSDISFQDKTQISWPVEQENFSSNNNSEKENQAANINDNTIADTDVFQFKFPESNDFDWNNLFMTNTKKKQYDDMYSPTDANLINDEPKLPDKTDIFSPKVENICTYLKKSECYRKNGIIYRELSEIKLSPFNTVCCILPLNAQKTTKIRFPDYPDSYKRPKRSNTDESTILVLRQRDALINRKLGQSQPLKQEPIPIRIAASDDNYDDPYWNIKNSNFKTPTKANSKFEYPSHDYVDDYVVEFPRPGLAGIYSDHGQRPTSWTLFNDKRRPYDCDDDYDDVDTGVSFGYSTVDPRKRVTSKPKRGRPLKLTSSSSEEQTRIEDSRITYQSSPDFQVLQGFKLLNLLPNKNRPKNPRHSTVKEGLIDRSDEYESDGEMSSEMANIEETQVFNGCGSSTMNSIENYEFVRDRQIGEAANGSHPWLALLVQTKKHQSIICYATIVHPRAAITAADCVYGSSPGEITLLAGLWQLNSDKPQSQQRLVSVHVHPLYEPGEFAHDLALLHWKRPLKLDLSVQPACLSRPRNSQDCKFVGWSGFDQAIQTRPRWQRASIVPLQTCLTLLGSSKHETELPEQAFCASVNSKGTVTGVGGALVCNSDGRQSAVGVAVWRDTVVILLPAQHWTTRAINALAINS